MIKVVMFDFDGVLVDSNEAWAHLYSKAAREAGLDPQFTYEDIRKHYGKPYIELIKDSLPGASDNETALDDMYKNVLGIASSDEFITSFRSIKGIKGTLSDLRKRFMLAVGSGNSKRFLDRFLEKTGLMSSFDLVVSSDDVKKGKPDPEMLFKALSHFKVEPYEAVYVGDSKADIMAAKSANMHSIAVLTGALTMEEALELQPDFIVNDATEVSEVLSCM